MPATNERALPLSGADPTVCQASSAFRITGMTGAANGHFGTGEFGKKNEDVIEWKRCVSMNPTSET
eukprot:919268-Rhodomonas_salina.1